MVDHTIFKPPENRKMDLQTQKRIHIKRQTKQVIQKCSAQDDSSESFDDNDENMMRYKTDIKKRRFVPNKVVKQQCSTNDLSESTDDD